MKFFRIAVCAFFVVSTVIFGFILFDRYTSDTTVPKIVCVTSEIELPVNATDAEMLAGVTATDAKDGDLTPKVMVEGISQFIEYGVANITYAVCDSDNHVSKITRRVRFTDYKSPRIYAVRDLTFVVNTAVNFDGMITASDVIDGNISNRIKLIASNVDVSKVGSYRITASVSNSMGDVSTMEFEVLVKEKPESNAQIELSTYTVYVKPGTKDFDPMSYVKNVTDINGTDADLSAVTFKSGVNVSKEGVYTVTYYFTDLNGDTASVRLNVVVADESGVR